MIASNQSESYGQCSELTRISVRYNEAKYNGGVSQMKVVAVTQFSLRILSVHW
jgi:hypothetical protein